LSGGSRRLEIPRDVEEALRELARNLERVLGKDFRLYLFGSYARGDWIRESDIDVVVVSPRFEGIAPHERASMVRKLAREDKPFDILCYTPQELERLLRESSFVREIASYWIEVYPQQPSEHRNDHSTIAV